MRIREFTTAGKHYTDKKLCNDALLLLADQLPIESLYTSYNGTKNSVSAWFTFSKVSSCFKVEFVELSELLDFLDSLNLRNPPQVSLKNKAAHAHAEKVYEDLQKIISESA